MEENNKSYFGEIKDAISSLLTGLSVTMREYFTPKVTEQYPENRTTTLRVAKRHRGRLVMKRDENDTVKCVACLMCEKACPNGTIRIASEMVTTEEGKKKRQLNDYIYDLGDCMFCELCTNACNFDAIEFTNDFENSVFDRNTLVLHLDKEHYRSSLPNIIEGEGDVEVGKFNTNIK